MRTSLVCQRAVLLASTLAVLLLCFPATSACDTLSAPVKIETNATDTTHCVTPRYILHVGSDNRSLLNNAPITKNITEQTALILDSLYNEFARIFHTTPSTQIVVRFLDPQEFRKQTGAPAWTSAMFLRGEITVPVSPNKSFNLNELSRTLRHEYTHAVVGELSAYKCPAWFDEGVAQLIEGDANPLIGPALIRWIERNDAIPLTWLTHGFTTLERSIVPAAYGQSFFAVHSLTNRYGFSSVLEYLAKLKANIPPDVAFATVYKTSLSSFESELTDQIKLWARGAWPKL